MSKQANPIQSRLIQAVSITTVVGGLRARGSSTPAARTWSDGGAFVRQRHSTAPAACTRCRFRSGLDRQMGRTEAGPITVRLCQKPAQRNLRAIHPPRPNTSQHLIITSQCRVRNITPRITSITRFYKRRAEKLLLDLMIYKEMYIR